MTTEMILAIFHGQIQLMTDMLGRGEMIYGGDRNNPGFKRFKRETMRVHYASIDTFWTLMSANDMVERCDNCEGMARRWDECPQCGGSGFQAVKTQEDRSVDSDDAE